MLARAGNDNAFVFGEASALVEKETDLPLELAHGPAAEEAFVFVERPLPRIVEAEEFDELRPTEPEDLPGRERCGERLLGFSHPWCGNWKNVQFANHWLAFFGFRHR